MLSDYHVRMIKYLGSKRVLVPTLVELVAELDGVKRVADLFSGTSRVGHALKRAGYAVIANDHNAYAESLALCYVQSDRSTHKERAEELLAALRKLRPKRGYFCRTFCEDSRFFQPHNGKRIDAMRDQIEAWSRAGELGTGIAARELKAILLVALMEAADRVDSTTGVQMAYLKAWADRAQRPLELRLPELLPRAKAGRSRALCLEAADAARKVADGVDLVYLDPPYNQHKYLGNYHIWETLVRWDAPDVYGIAKKRIDCRDKKSAFNSKPAAAAALQAVIDGALSGARVRYVLLSFNDEGYLARADIEAMLKPHGKVQTIEVDYKRYVGAQIGIHNQKGQRVGRIGRLRNKELLFLLKRKP